MTTLLTPALAPRLRRLDEDFESDPGIHRSVVLLDASRSMLRRDGAACSRSAMLREIVARLLSTAVQTAADHLIGIVSFNRSARCLHPLAHLRSQFHSILQSLRDVRCEGWSDLAAAICLGSQMLTDDFGSAATMSAVKCDRNGAGPMQRQFQPRLIIATDGDFEPDFQLTQVVAGAQQDGICIGMIAIGTDANQEGINRLASPRPDGTPRSLFIRQRCDLDDCRWDTL